MVRTTQNHAHTEVFLLAETQFFAYAIVGYYTAKFFHENGGSRVTGIIEHDGYVHNEDGLDVEALHEHMLATGSILGFPGAES